MTRKTQQIVRAASAFLAFALVWEFIGRFVITGRYAFAPLSVVIAETYHQFASGAIDKHVITSGYELGIGFTLAAIVGIAMGVAIGVSTRAGDYLLPLVYAANATPIVALAPLFILLLGVGPASKIVVI